MRHLHQFTVETRRDRQQVRGLQSELDDQMVGNGHLELRKLILRARRADGFRHLCANGHFQEF